ncbi:hypothetical protein [Hydrogenophaga sp.]|nr:hypothetical protein [Hydrogenophaga sp.]MDP2417005.1 hypothetical protein [Hydrogenophaga sp.]
MKLTERLDYAPIKTDLLKFLLHNVAGWIKRGLRQPVSVVQRA